MKLNKRELRYIEKLRIMFERSKPLNDLFKFEEWLYWSIKFKKLGYISKDRKFGIKVVEKYLDILKETNAKKFIESLIDKEKV